MKGPFRRGARPGDAGGDERVQRRLREFAEQADRAPRTPPTVASPAPVEAQRFIHVPRTQLTYAPPVVPPYVPQFAAQAPSATPPARVMRGVLLVLVALLVALLVLTVTARIEASGPQGWTSKHDPNKPLTAWPAAPAGIAGAPLGQPPTNVPNSDSYAFMREQPITGEPVTYDPCAPIHYVVNDRTAFDGALEELDAAIAEIEEATGLVFVNDGATEEAPILKRAVQDEHYGKSWSPVLVSWSDGFEYEGVKGTIVGRGGSTSIRQGSHEWYVTGVAIFDGPQMREVYRRPNGPALVRAIIMHELGHVVGLHHVSDQREIMKPGASRETTSWGPGDRAGLAQLGAGNCIAY